MQLELELQPRRGHALLLASSPEAAWQGAMLDWFKQAAVEAWRSARPTLVVVPSVVGTTQTAAAATITAAGLTLGTVTLTSSTSIPAG